MNVFILSTGRCGSTTFERACSHIKNFTATHESRVNQLGEERLNYPKFHIESDNRLSWFLGRLDERYTENDSFYVHLIRDTEAVATSYAKRFFPGLIMPAYADGIYIDLPPNKEPWKKAIANDYVNTVNKNIELFLRNKENKLVICLPEVQKQFPSFWEAIGAKGNLQEALKEFDVKYNFAGSGVEEHTLQASKFSKVLKKVSRIMTKFPGFIRNA